MRLVDLLPGRYIENSPETAEFQRALQGVTDAMAEAYDEMLLQLDVQTASQWLDLWERMYGLEPDVEKPIEYRRSRLISKMRGSGTTTVQLIQNTAESFSNGSVDVIEYPTENRFEIKFTSQIGMPPNIEDLTAAIEEIKPAHLAYSYIILYRTWGQLKQYIWADLSSHIWADVKGGSLD